MFKKIVAKNCKKAIDIGKWIIFNECDFVTEVFGVYGSMMPVQFRSSLLPNDSKYFCKKSKNEYFQYRAELFSALTF